MALYSLEQLEILMLVAGAEEPVPTALAVRRRWRYILSVALAAQEGRVIDASLPVVVQDSHAYAERARAILDVLDEWLTERLNRTDLYGAPPSPENRRG